MNYAIHEHQTLQVLSVNDLLSEYNNKKILRTVLSRIDRFPNFVVDLDGMEVMNSVGLNFLITLRSKSKERGGDMAVVNASGRILKLLEMTKLRSIFKLAPTVEDAIDYFEA